MKCFLICCDFLYCLVFVLYIYIYIYIYICEVIVYLKTWLEEEKLFYIKSSIPLKIIYNKNDEWIILFYERVNHSLRYIWTLPLKIIYGAFQGLAQWSIMWFISFLSWIRFSMCMSVTPAVLYLLIGLAGCLVGHGE